jgi:FkbM family methyltransferase
LFEFPQGKAYIDCGAYNGDTILRFVQKYGNNNPIICFEPDNFNFKLLKQNTDKFFNVLALNKGCSDKTSTLTFRIDENNRQQCTISENGETSIDVVKIDHYTNDYQSVGLIKMDIEGAELSALHGATDTIVRDKPVLSICVYHKADDLITIHSTSGRLFLSIACIYATTKKPQ